MKVLVRILSLITIVSTAVFFANCGGGDGGGSAKEKAQLAKLSKTWILEDAELNGDPRADDFDNFELTISGTYNADSPEGPYEYDVTGSRPDPSPWPGASDGNGGTWEFVSFQSGDKGTLLRDDGVSMTYQINSAGDLILTVNCLACEYEGARTSEVNGVWTFTFSPE